jgi:hypothetical protein
MPKGWRNWVVAIFSVGMLAALLTGYKLPAYDQYTMAFCLLVYAWFDGK